VDLDKISGYKPRDSDPNSNHNKLNSVTKAGSEGTPTAGWSTTDLQYAGALLFLMVWVILLWRNCSNQNIREWVIWVKNSLCGGKKGGMGNYNTGQGMSDVTGAGGINGRRRTQVGGNNMGNNINRVVHNHAEDMEFQQSPDVGFEKGWNAQVVGKGAGWNGNGTHNAGWHGNGSTINSGIAAPRYETGATGGYVPPRVRGVNESAASTPDEDTPLHGVHGAV
jgi:hypothetical protein